MSQRLPKTKIHSMTSHQPNTFNTLKNITMLHTPPFLFPLLKKKRKWNLKSIIWRQYSKTQRFSKEFDVGTGLQGLVTKWTRGFQVPCDIRHHFLLEHTVNTIKILPFLDNFQKTQILVLKIGKQLIYCCPQNIFQKRKIFRRIETEENSTVINNTLYVLSKTKNFIPTDYK